MKLSDHDLLQLTDEELLEWPEEVLRILSIKLLSDLKEARERLRQTSRNSSRPPSSDLPWDKTAVDKATKPPQPDDLSEVDDATQNRDEISQKRPDEKPPDKASDTDQTQERNDNNASHRRKAGKQPGAAGFGREQKLAVTAEDHHYPTDCALCERELKQSAAIAYTAFETIDLEWANPSNPGIRLTHTPHTY